MSKSKIKNNNKNNIFYNHKNYFLYTILFSIFLIVMSYISINISLSNSYFHDKVFSIFTLLSICEGLLFVFIYLLYCVYKNEKLFKKEFQKIPKVMAIIFISVIVIFSITGKLEYMLDKIIWISYLSILAVTSFVTKKSKVKEKSTKLLSYSSLYWFLIVGLIICYIIFILPKVFSSIEGLSQNEASSSTSLSISIATMFIYPMYFIYFIMCTWLNSKHFNFRWLIYPVMSITLYMIICIHIASYSAAAGWLIMFSIVPQIILAIILFILGFCIDSAKVLG